MTLDSVRECTAVFGPLPARFAYLLDGEDKGLYPIPAALIGYTVDAVTGRLTPITGLSMKVKQWPTRLVDALNSQFLYANTLPGGTIHAYRVHPTTELLTEIQGPPYSICSAYMAL
ncbi:hypothetical protein [Pajaroellobacter abortibovis]|uniref:Uncharacterized protein n=1 Tax=Pajaroellobacter abortibovis TaxID=1882918 RepID=A0A1L6MVT2_9BACT|nr:hypothetical protein [Pajaroellobacter abortibovis]APR99626.1 hypothetical protein BCY86_02245 [Pajaroellobacter abortibovis]